VPGRWLALTLALIIHAAFIAVLVFSIRWQNRQPDAVVAELYAPPVAAPAMPPPAPPPKPEPQPEPQRQPQPEPPPPAPAPAPKPAPVIEKPDPQAAEIALKAKQEAERAQREREAKEAELREAEKKKLEEHKREIERKKLEEQKREAEKKKLEEQKREAEKKKLEEQKREAEALKAQAARERQAREAEALKAQAAREAQARAASAADARARADYEARIRAKIRGNINEPGNISGNPEAVFSVIQLPTGDIIDVKLVRSSGLRAYDDAVERAIRKSSPLPRPERPDLWTRELILKVRPRDN